MKLTLMWFRTHRDSRRRTGGRRPVCTSLLSDRRQGCRRSWWSWDHRVQDSSSRVCSCTCNRGSDEWRPPSVADQTTDELLLTSRHDRPTAAGSDRGWATQPHRRTSHRRRNGWGTLGEPAAWSRCKKKNITPMKQQLCHRVNWSVCNVVKCQELKAELEPLNLWGTDSKTQEEVDVWKMTVSPTAMGVEYEWAALNMFWIRLSVTDQMISQHCDTWRTARYQQALLSCTGLCG